MHGDLKRERERALNRDIDRDTQTIGKRQTGTETENNVDKHLDTQTDRNPGRIYVYIERDGKGH